MRSVTDSFSTGSTERGRGESTGRQAGAARQEPAAGRARRAPDADRARPVGPQRHRALSLGGDRQGGVTPRLALTADPSTARQLAQLVGEPPSVPAEVRHRYAKTLGLLAPAGPGQTQIRLAGSRGGHLPGCDGRPRLGDDRDQGLDRGDGSLGRRRTRSHVLRSDPARPDRADGADAVRLLRRAALVVVPKLTRDAIESTVAAMTRHDFVDVR